MIPPDRFGAHRLRAEAKEVFGNIPVNVIEELAERMSTDDVDFVTVIEHHPLIAAHMIRMALWEERLKEKPL